MKLPSGKTMKITTKNNSKKNIYIQSVKLNGKPYTKAYIDHATLLEGGELEFEMGIVPNKKWGLAAKTFLHPLHSDNRLKRVEILEARPM
jgi:putative alpha-1,2-mannosidase